MSRREVRVDVSSRRRVPCSLSEDAPLSGEDGAETRPRLMAAAACQAMSQRSCLLTRVTCSFSAFYSFPNHTCDSYPDI